jgi:hypothetical protein
MDLRLRTDNPELIWAWKALYDCPYDDRKIEHLNEPLGKKQLLLIELKDNFGLVINRKSITSAALVNHKRTM